jgi:hypothetical protein
MLVRRDIAPIVCYGALFATVVLWAALRPTNPNLTESRDTRASMLIGPHYVADDRPEMRRVVKHMGIP